MTDFLTTLKQHLGQGLLPQKHHDLLKQFYLCYQKSLEHIHLDPSVQDKVFLTFLDLVEQQISKPFSFEPYHKQVRSPFDHYQFGLNFMRPLIDIKHSSLRGLHYLDEICHKLQAGENVIFLANHQIEADPQAISILLEERYPKLAKELIFVAGERVITDPLAIPFSMGYNLLCIYSKRYIDHPPHLKLQKQLHNKKTMELMSQLLYQGGHAIYVAPSGGRDRKDTTGAVNVAPFDPASIEMFYLMTQKKDSPPTSFYPMALYTYDLLPPPNDIQLELGEERKAQRSAIHLAIGPCIAMEQIPGLDLHDKKKRREQRANYIWSIVHQEYKKFPIPTS